MLWVKGPRRRRSLSSGRITTPALGCPERMTTASGVAATLFLAETLEESCSKISSLRLLRERRATVLPNRTDGQFRICASDAVAKPRRSWQCCRSRRSATTPTSRAAKRYPFGVHLGFPNTGNFIGFVSNSESRTLVESRHRNLPSQRELPVRRDSCVRTDPGSRLVGSLVLLASGICGGDGHGYCTVSLPALSPSQ